MYKKILIVVLAATFMATPAFAQSETTASEFDAVGVDALNYFNDRVKEFIADNSEDTFGVLINDYSSFPREDFDFDSLVGLTPDICFVDEEYLSGYTHAGEQGDYTWKIVLQKDPATDIVLNIRDCVLRAGSWDIWSGAEQSGRTNIFGEYRFYPFANPKITVMACPGDHPCAGFTKCFIMDARYAPCLAHPVEMDEQRYTSVAMWEDSITLIRPRTGKRGCGGQNFYDLNAGDVIRVKIEIDPWTFYPVSHRYGPDNVTVQYAGVKGTEVTN
jgi:hypothetical protein